jgi:hypothetical protein
VLISYPNEILELNPKGTVVSRRALPTPFGPAASGMASAVDGRVWLGDYRNLYAISMSGPQATLYPPASTLQACQSSATQVARGEQISLWGRALDQATSVTLGITPAAFTIVSPVQLAITVPAGAPAGEASLSVGSATGSSSLPYPVDVEDPPTITSVSPSCGSPSGGDLIEVQGTELDAVTSATVGGQAATIDTSYKFGQSPSENSVWIYTPQHTLPATVDVRVRTVAGTSPVSPADHFTYSLTCGGV